MVDTIFLIQEKIKLLMLDYLSNTDDASYVLDDAIFYALFSGGKYLRGLICIEMSSIFDIKKDNALILASIIEMIHCYSLIHDDLPGMDCSDLRRGIPSVHKKFGEANAILSGSLLLILAIRIANDHFSSDLVAKVNEHVAYMIRGQAIDMTIKKRSSSLKEMLHMYKLKTGAMFALSASMGSIVSEINVDYMSTELLENFGFDFGILFQIYDDIQDSLSGEKGILDVISKSESKDLYLHFKEKCFSHLKQITLGSTSSIYKIINELSCGF